jgi:hypothetical protein
LFGKKDREHKKRIEQRKEAIQKLKESLLYAEIEHKREGIMKLRYYLKDEYSTTKHERRVYVYMYDEQGNLYDTMRDYKTIKEALAFINRDNINNPLGLDKIKHDLSKT